MFMPRVAACVLLGMTCTPTASPPPTPPPVEDAAEPEPAYEPTPIASADDEPLPTTKKSQPPPREPPVEALNLSNEQLTRARAVQAHVAAASVEFTVDPNLLNGIIWAESKFNPKAHNKSGAKGLMQLMPTTGKAMARKLERSFRPYDPEFSIDAGALLLSGLLKKFDGDEKLALFGYARGTGRVREWQREGGPIPEGVTKFIARVTRARATFEALGFPEAAS